MNFSEITYSSKQVVCEHPRLIINPLLPELIAKYKYYVFRGYHVIVKKSHIHFYNFDYRPFSIKRNNITTDDIDTCYVVDKATGETFPIYVQVPCNECAICMQRKVFGFVQRCKFEAQQYDSRPWFVTLTYDNEHLPKGNSLDKRDVQLFLKRLRINLKRHGFDYKIRYVMVGEYGSNTHRPHYHLILFGINSFTHQECLDVSDIIYTSWKNGFIQHRQVDPSNEATFYYTTKYMRKHGYVPEGACPPFVLPRTGAVALAPVSLIGLPMICENPLTLITNF